MNRRKAIKTLGTTTGAVVVLRGRPLTDTADAADLDLRKERGRGVRESFCRKHDDN